MGNCAACGILLNLEVRSLKPSTEGIKAIKFYV